MSYDLHLDQPAGAALRRVAAEELDAAATGLADVGADRERTIHETRKHIKKTRAVLALARRCMPRKVSQAERTALRDIAQQLSGSRDADVMRNTVMALGKRFAGQL